MVPDSVHAWQWDCYDKEEEHREDKKEEAQREHSKSKEEEEGQKEYHAFTEGGSSSSGYSPEYLEASPAAQKVLQAGMLLQRAL